MREHPISTAYERSFGVDKVNTDAPIVGHSMQYAIYRRSNTTSVWRLTHIAASSSQTEAVQEALHVPSVADSPASTERVPPFSRTFLIVRLAPTEQAPEVLPSAILDSRVIQDQDVATAVRARAYRDDYAIDFEFNAAPWLAQASVEEIIDLARCGWGGDYAADAVAIESEALLQGTAEGDKLSALFALTSTEEDEGFECHLDHRETAANLSTWLKQYRPDAFERLTVLELLPSTEQFG